MMTQVQTVSSCVSDYNVISDWRQLEAHDVSRSDVAPVDIPLFQRYSSVNTTAASATKDNMNKMLSCRRETALHGAL